MEVVKTIFSFIFWGIIFISLCYYVFDLIWFHIKLTIEDNDLKDEEFQEASDDGETVHIIININDTSPDS